jgi:uncharacterized membrane protein
MTANKLASKVKYNYTLSIREGEYLLRFKIRSGLLLLNLLVIVLAVVIILSTANILRIILGLPFVLFFPGYALMVALFPSKTRISGIERVALSFGLSIAVVSLIGLILNYTPWGIRLESMLSSTASFIFIMSIIAWLRQRGLAEQERYDIGFRLKIPSWGMGVWDKALSIILVLTILGALGMIGYAIAAPKIGEKFTEFYFLGQEGREGSYPRQLIVGEEGRVVVGIANNEYKIINYWVEVRINGVKNNEVEGILLKHGERWENEVSFTPTVAGAKQKIEFLLYEEGEDTPLFEPLRLWVDVVE